MMYGESRYNYAPLHPAALPIMPFIIKPTPCSPAKPKPEHNESEQNLSLPNKASTTNHES